MGKKKGSKRKAKQALVEVDGAAQEAQKANKHVDGGASGGTEPVDSTGGRRYNVSLLPAESQQYLTEVIAHFHALMDDEEKQLLVANVMEEIAGKEQKAAADPVCSRHIETLLSVAQPSQLMAFLGSAMDTGGLFELAVSPFGSHVTEKMLLRLESQLDVMSEEEYDAFTKVLEMIVRELCTDLWKFVMDRFATHVARRVLCMLCGHDVLPSGSRGQSQSNGGGCINKAAAGLAAKLATKDKAPGRQGGDFAEGCRFPELLESLVSMLTREDFGGAFMEELLTSKYGSPFVQAALKAASLMQGNRSLLATLIPSLLGTSYFYDAGNRNKVPSGAKLIEGVSADRVYAMCMDSTTSHVVEAVMGVAHAVPGLVDAMLQRFFRGRLQDLAFHQSANFVLQGVLAATTTPAQVQPLYEELAPCMGDLLRCRRSGVLAALLAACGRANCCQKEACSALAAAITSMPQSAGKTGHEVLAPSLLCLDAAPLLGRNEPLKGAADIAEGRMSSLGSAILITVLRFSQNACRDFTDSVAALGLWDLARCSRDPSGSRTLEAFLDGSAPAKMKQKLLACMVGGAYGTMALTGSGSFLLERCFDMAEGPTKEAIIAELLGREREVESKYWGPHLLKRLGAEKYKRDPLQWRRHLESTAKTRLDFEKLFGSDFDDAPKPSKQQKKQRQHQQQSGQGKDVGAECGGIEKGAGTTVCGTQGNMQGEGAKGPGVGGGDPCSVGGHDPCSVGGHDQGYQGDVERGASEEGGKKKKKKRKAAEQEGGGGEHEEGKKRKQDNKSKQQ